MLIGKETKEREGRKGKKGGGQAVRASCRAETGPKRGLCQAHLQGMRDGMAGREFQDHVPHSFTDI